MKTTSPAKIILSGEHSVVYGAPAIGAPLGLCLEAEWEQRGDGRIFLQEEEVAPSWDAMPAILRAYRDRYDEFKAGAGDIRAVLPEPRDLALLTLAAFHERRGGMDGISVSLRTDIPPSCGLGSSAALVTVLLRGLLSLSGGEMPEKEFLAFARGIEDFQHGTSSGIDLALVSARAPLVFERERGVVESLSLPEARITLVNTGRPETSTGACVARVRDRHANDTARWDDFASCTRDIRVALEQNNRAALAAGVDRNHDLLCGIGVVPEKVGAFIADCRARGMAAKVCGAGAVAGAAAGMVWVLARDAGSMQDLGGIAAAYGYEHGDHALAL